MKDKIEGRNDAQRKRTPPAEKDRSVCETIVEIEAGGGYYRKRTDFCY